MQSQTNSIIAFPIGIAPFRGNNPLRWISVAGQVLGVIRQRRQLATLSNSQLADIGITREQAQTEAARPFWDLPAK